MDTYLSFFIMFAAACIMVAIPTGLLITFAHIKFANVIIAGYVPSAVYLTKALMEWNIKWQ